MEDTSGKHEIQGRPNNEIIVKSHSKIMGLVEYGTKILENGSESDILIIGEGNAIPKVINVAEMIKEKILGLEQSTKIERINNEDNSSMGFVSRIEINLKKEN